MLVLSRTAGERVRVKAEINGMVVTVWVTVVEVDRGKVRLGFDGHRTVDFSREELLDPSEQYLPTKFPKKKE